MLLGYPSYHRAIPLVSVSSAGEDRRTSFERYMLGCSDLEAAHVSIYHEVADFVAGDPVRDVCQHRVEAVQLCTAGLVLNNAPVLAKTSEIEVPYNMWMHNERCS